MDPAGGDAAGSRLIDRVGISPRRARQRGLSSDQDQAAQATQGTSPLSGSGTFAPPSPEESTKHQPDVPISSAVASPRQRERAANLSAGLPPTPTPNPSNSGLSARLSSLFGRPRADAKSSKTASAALSRLAVDLQPKAANFEYHWSDGELQVKRAGGGPGVAGK